MPLPPLTPVATAVQTAKLRWKLLQLRARYDDGAIAPAIYQLIKEIKTTLSWSERQQRVEVVPTHRGNE